MNRRLFLLSLPAIACAVARAETITILRCDHDRFNDTEKLQNLLCEDIKDMDVHRQVGANFQRIRSEDHLYARIQSERGDCRPDL